MQQYRTKTWVRQKLMCSCVRKDRTVWIPGLKLKKEIRKCNARLCGKLFGEQWPRYVSSNFTNVFLFFMKELRKRIRALFLIGSESMFWIFPPTVLVVKVLEMMATFSPSDCVISPLEERKKNINLTRMIFFEVSKATLLFLISSIRVSLYFFYAV